MRKRSLVLAYAIALLLSACASSNTADVQEESTNEISVASSVATTTEAVPVTETDEDNSDSEDTSDINVDSSNEADYKQAYKKIIEYEQERIASVSPETSPFFRFARKEEKMDTINSMKKTLGERIREQRILMQMTQEELAEELCVKKSTISMYENDKVDIKGSILIELSGVLHTSPNYLLGMEEYEEDLLEIITVYKNLKGSKTKQIALEQMKLLATMSSEL